MKLPNSFMRSHCLILSTNKTSAVKEQSHGSVTAVRYEKDTRSDVLLIFALLLVKGTEAEGEWFVGVLVPLSVTRYGTTIVLNVHTKKELAKSLEALRHFQHCSKKNSTQGWCYYN